MGVTKNKGFKGIPVPISIPGKPTVYLVVTYDEWKTRTSANVRGLFASLTDANKAIETLVKNEVADLENIVVHIIEIGKFEPDGGFIL